MTRRERIQRKIEKRLDWSASRAQESDRRFDAARSAVAGIPFGQPILVGHHSEGRHRAALKRSDNNMRAAVESHEMAQRHSSVAASLQIALDTSIYSDDTDAVEALEKRIAEREAESERMRLVNKAHAKFMKTGKLDEALTAAEKVLVQTYKPPYSFEPRPYPPYKLSNLRGRITADKKRLEVIKRRNARSERAAQAGGCVVEKSASGEHCQVTFAEKPDRSVLVALRSAGFHFSGGSWFGQTKDLPAEVSQQVEA